MMVGDLNGDASEFIRVWRGRGYLNSYLPPDKHPAFSTLSP